MGASPMSIAEGSTGRIDGLSARLEGLIADAEGDAATLRARLKAAPGEDWERLAELATEERALTSRIEALMTEWSTLGEEIANEQATLSGSSRT